MKTRFFKHLDSIKSEQLYLACIYMTETPDFLTHPASLSHHHAYEGGLLAHTVEVCDIALRAYHGMKAELASDPTHYVGEWQWIDLPPADILIAAALWHDFCKVREYRFFWDWPANTVGQKILRIPGTDEQGLQKFWKHTDYGNRIHHIQGSAIEFTVAARKHGVAEDVIKQIQHCILAHHGRKEWGSPVEPQTLEALILHQADMLSAQYGATKEVAP